MQVGSLACFEQAIAVVVVQHGDFNKSQNMAIHHDVYHKSTYRLVIDKGFGSELDVSSGLSIIAQSEGEHIVDGLGLSSVKVGQVYRSVGDGNKFRFGGKDHCRTVKCDIGIVRQREVESHRFARIQLAVVVALSVIDSIGIERQWTGIHGIDSSKHIHAAITIDIAFSG